MAPVARAIQAALPTILALTAALLSVLAVSGVLKAQGVPPSRSVDAAAPTSLPIGTVTDVTVDQLGRVYIADERTAQIHVLDQRLNPTVVLGGRGIAPGKFLSLRAVRTINSNTLVALDNALRRITLYRLDAANVPQLTGVVAMPFDPFDVCSLGNDRLLVLGAYKRHRLHVVDLQGRLLSSHAPFDERIAPLVARSVLTGHLNCMRADNALLLSSELIPLVEWYSLDSLQLIDKQFLAPFRPLEVEYLEATEGIRMASGPQGYHSPGRGLEAGTLRVIGARVLARTDRAPPDSVRWFRFDPKTRDWTGYADGLGRVFPISGDTVLWIREYANLKLQLVRVADLISHWQRPGSDKRH